MGHDMYHLREANLSNVTKQLVHADTPCAAELGALMDCMKVVYTNDRSVLFVEASANKNHRDGGTCHPAASWHRGRLRMLQAARSAVCLRRKARTRTTNRLLRKASDSNQAAGATPSLAMPLYNRNPCQQYSLQFTSNAGKRLQSGAWALRTNRHVLLMRIHSRTACQRPSLSHLCTAPHALKN